MIYIHEVIGTHEVQTLGFLKSLIAELLGTCILVVVGCGSAATLSLGGSSDSLGIGLVFGLAVATVIWIFGHISGAHINPSISIGFFVTGHISLLKCVFYVAVQIVGGIAGAALLLLILPQNIRGTMGSPALAEGVANWQGFLVEMIATFLLVLTVFATCDKMRTDHGGSFALSIGLCVAAQITWMGNVTGGCLNPARSIGPVVFTGMWENHWVYWTGPISGGILAALLYERVFAERAKEPEKQAPQVSYNNCKVDPNGFIDYIDIENPSVIKSESKARLFNIGNNNADDVINLENNEEKEQIFLKSFVALETNSYSSSTEENCVHCQQEQVEVEKTQEIIAEDTSNL